MEKEIFSYIDVIEGLVGDLLGTVMVVICLGTWPMRIIRGEGIM